MVAEDRSHTEARTLPYEEWAKRAEGGLGRLFDKLKAEGRHDEAADVFDAMTCIHALERALNG